MFCSINTPLEAVSIIACNGEVGGLAGLHNGNLRLWVMVGGCGWLAKCSCRAASRNAGKRGELTQSFTPGL